MSEQGDVDNGLGRRQGDMTAEHPFLAQLRREAVRERQAEVDAILTEMYPDVVCTCGHHLCEHTSIAAGSEVDVCCAACPCESYDGPFEDDEW